MTTRWAKLLLIAAVAFNYTLVVLGNLTDFNSNYEFVRHVLLMDSTFPGNHGLWRAIHTPALHLVFYWSIILWEFASMILAWWGAVNLCRALRLPAQLFNSQKRMAIGALTISMLMWLFAFLEIGGEWFMMWQSKIWNGQDEAYRMFFLLGLVLLLLLQPDTDPQP
jgi:predicted small integral membrane protein